MAIASLVLVLLSPLLVIVALAIKLDDRGPVLFIQRRMGRGNRFFAILKFRSMCREQQDGAGDRSTVREDQRITRVGRLIRATSIDELPQLINVIRGEMSQTGGVWSDPDRLGRVVEPDDQDFQSPILSSSWEPRSCR